MKPVHQTFFDDERGNCEAACIASLLELPLDAVPNFVESPKPNEAEDEFLASHGLRAIRILMVDESHAATTRWQFGPCIVWGVSPRTFADGSVKYHSVVAEPNAFGFKIIHDPHPSGDGLPEGPLGVMFIVPAGDISKTMKETP